MIRELFQFWILPLHAGIHGFPFWFEDFFKDAVLAVVHEKQKAHEIFDFGHRNMLCEISLKLSKKTEGSKFSGRGLV